MPSILTIPKVQLAAILFLIYITAAIKFPSLTTFYLLIFCVGFSVFFDLLLTFLRKRTLFIPFAAIVTGLIMTLIVDRSSEWFYIATAAVLAMGIKNFLRIDGRHIFNPVASGLFLSGLIFSQYPGWWGVSFQEISGLKIENLLFFLILLLPLTVSAIRLKRYYAIFIFLILSSTLSIESIFSTFLNPSLVFFAVVMLPEPMTSPVNYKRQIIYGALVAVIPFVLAVPTNFAIDPLLLALLLGNLIFFKNR